MNKKYIYGFITVPMAILIAGIIIGLSIIYVAGKGNIARDNQKDSALATASAIDKIKIPSADDHILGDPNAPVKIVEFSDPECPFCKRFHTTMHQIMDAENGKVAWVYRHFPLDTLHSKARKEAEAIECAASVGGNDKFWAYLDRLMDVTPSNDGLDKAELPVIAEYVGLDAAGFEACIESGKTAARVQSDYEDAVASGAEGTPYSVIIGRDGKKYPIGGAFPLASVKKILDEALR